MPQRFPYSGHRFVVRRRSLVAGAVLIVLAVAGGLMASANSRHGTSSGRSQSIHLPLDVFAKPISYELEVRVERGVPNDPIRRSIYMVLKDERERLQRLNRERNPEDPFRTEP
jgi:hypothetical protein